MVPGLLGGFETGDRFIHRGLQSEKLLQPNQFHRLRHPRIADNLQCPLSRLRLFRKLNQYPQPRTVHKINFGQIQNQVLRTFLNTFTQNFAERRFRKGVQQTCEAE